jgi:putative alpha-1,2-mannosidase
MRRIDSASITDMDNYYSNQPDGIAGNEDCAQTSAWYVFTAMGFYPLNPVSGDYMIGSPLFTKLTLQLAGNKGFVISAPANSADNPHIQSVRLNGRPLDTPLITYRGRSDGSARYRGGCARRGSARRTLRCATRGRP